MIQNVIDIIFTMLLTVAPHLVLAGRILIATLFIWAGLSNIYYKPLKTKTIYDRGIPFPSVVLWIGIVIQIICGLGVLFNVYVIPATLLLFVFNLVAAFIFHDFWNANGEAYRLKMQGFVNNIGIFGALCLLLFISLLDFGVRLTV